MIIQFDIDGVLADFVQGFTTLARKWFPDVPVTRTADQPLWSGFPRMTKGQIDVIWREVTGSWAFWQGLDALESPALFWRLDDLRARHELYFVTSRPGETAKVQTEAWLHRRGIYNPTVIISGKKAEIAKAIKANFSIEDKPSNGSCIDWMTDGRTKSYLINRPYNRMPNEFLASGVKRVNTVSEFIDEVNA